ncbi:unnamed protein product [Mytilus edulis]|uniref:PDZ domain-containing protein n=1 Tax=Mytilus edulis TaxID=6550 RepID=A0A8S3S8W8_MYTED|nr:unnamed protein product [Mytilus edulis]
MLLDIFSGIVLDLRIKKDVITDNSPVLTELCIILEDIFTRGCRDTSWFNKTNYRYWTWIEKISQSGRYQPAFHMVIDTTCTDSGRGRLFIRSALSKKVLAVPVQQIVKDQQLLQEFYYSYNTVIGDEILSDLLLGGNIIEDNNELYICRNSDIPLTGAFRVTFHLKIHNSSFLDKTWELPIYKNFEFVPCGDLGLNVQQVQEYFIVKSIKPGSVAEEDGKIGPGDVIDELYSFALTPLSLPNVHKLMAKHKGLPVYVGVIKLCDRAGKYFPPIVRLLEEININPRNLQKEIVPDDKDNNNSDRKPGHAILPEEEDAERPVHAPDGSALYKATYLGNVDLGPDGRVNRIEDGVDLVLRNHKQVIEVLIDLREKDVIVSDATNNNKVILRQTYTEISACGRRTDLMKYFGYIAGETTCSLARNFLCHVF